MAASLDANWGDLEGLWPLHLTPIGAIYASPWGGVVAASLDANWGDLRVALALSRIGISVHHY